MAEYLERHHRHAAFFIREMQRHEGKVKGHHAVFNLVKSRWFDLLWAEKTESQQSNLHEVELRLTVLRKNKSSLDERKAAIETQIMMQALAISQKETVAIRNTFQNKLPRELRDLVYAYLIQPDSKFGCRSLIMIEDGPTSRYPVVSSPSDFQGFLWPDAPYFWRPEYLGDCFFLELAELRLSTAIFIFDSRLDLFSQLIVSKNGFGLALADLVRHVHVTVGVTYTPDDDNLQYDHNSTKENLLERLKNLMVLRRGSLIDVAIRVGSTATWHTRHRWKALREVLNVIWPLLSLLKTSGYTLRVFISCPEIVFWPSAAGFSIDAWSEKIKYVSYSSLRVQINTLADNGSGSHLYHAAHAGAVPSVVITGYSPGWRNYIHKKA